jgi:hypothetical protein
VIGLQGMSFSRPHVALASINVKYTEFRLAELADSVQKGKQLIQTIENPNMTEFIQKDETALRGHTRTSFDFGDFDHHNIPLPEEQYPVIIIGSSKLDTDEGILIRPDGLIAWRGIARSEKTKTTSLKAVLKQILGM